MFELTTTFEKQEIRIVGAPERPEWVASDVAKVLAINNVRQVLSRFDEDEKGVTNSDTLGGKQRLLTVTEPGLYRLILKSRKVAARAFRRWVLHEVLPSIRKHGCYPAPATDPAAAESSLVRGIHTPSYRLHKPSGLAVVTIDGHDHYLGRHDTPESRQAYERIIALWSQRPAVRLPRGPRPIESKWKAAGELSSPPTLFEAVNPSSELIALADASNVVWLPCRPRYCTLRQWVHRGLEAIRIGRHLYTSEAALFQFFQHRAGERMPEPATVTIKRFAPSMELARQTAHERAKATLKYQYGI